MDWSKKQGKFYRFNDIVGVTALSSHVSLPLINSVCSQDLNSSPLFCHKNISGGIEPFGGLIP
jgi:hypothetical protein